LLENDIAALETGHRGFLLTGDRGYIDIFERRREAIKERITALAGRIVENSQQRKRVMKVQEIVSTWLTTIAVPEMTARQAKATGAPAGAAPAGALGSALLDQAREHLRTLQNDEQIVLNERMRDQEWAAQSTQILGFLPKLERSVVEMEKEKRGYLLTADNSFVEAYKRATAAFYTYHGYLSILVANSPSKAPF
jgi:CHASE3 domain sensor protein